MAVETGRGSRERSAFRAVSLPDASSVPANTLAIVDKRLSRFPYLVGERPTVADISLAGYLYYPAEEFGFDIAKDYPAIGAWTDRIKALPGWKHPYELMRGHPLGTR